MSNWINKLFNKKPNKPSNALKFEDMIDHCGGCYWREIKRFQKCSTCRRNSHMKDNYIKAEQMDGDKHEG